MKFVRSGWQLTPRFSFESTVDAKAVTGGVTAGRLQAKAPDGTIHEMSFAGLGSGVTLSPSKCPLALSLSLPVGTRSAVFRNASRVSGELKRDDFVGHFALLTQSAHVIMASGGFIEIVFGAPTAAVLLTKFVFPWVPVIGFDAQMAAILLLCKGAAVVFPSANFELLPDASLQGMRYTGRIGLVESTPPAKKGTGDRQKGRPAEDPHLPWYINGDRGQTRLDD